MAVYQHLVTGSGYVGNIRLGPVTPNNKKSDMKTRLLSEASFKKIKVTVELRQFRGDANE